MSSERSAAHHCIDEKRTRLDRVLTRRFQAGLHVCKHVFLQPGAQWPRRQRWALHQRAFKRILPPFPLFFTYSTHFSASSRLECAIKVSHIGTGFSFQVQISFFSLLNCFDVCIIRHNRSERFPPADFLQPQCRVVSLSSQSFLA